MAYDTLAREAKDLPEDMIQKVIEFMRFLKYASKKEQTEHSISNNIACHRSVNPLADEFKISTECQKINKPQNL